METDLIKNWLISNVDICFVSETHLKPKQKFNILPFVTINHPYEGPSKVPRGGISCSIKPDYIEYISNIDKSQSEIIVLSLLGGHKVFSCYIPQADSVFLNMTCLHQLVTRLFQ